MSKISSDTSSFIHLFFLDQFSRTFIDLTNLFKEPTFILLVFPVIFGNISVISASYCLASACWGLIRRFPACFSMRRLRTMVSGRVSPLVEPRSVIPASSWLYLTNAGKLHFVIVSFRMFSSFPVITYLTLSEL